MQTLPKPVKGLFFDLGWTLVYPLSGDWELTESAMKLFHWEACSSLPPERVAAARKAANDYFLPRHRLSTREEEYDQYLHFYGELARLLPELGITRQNIEVAALEKVYQPQHTFGIFQDAFSTLQALRGRYKLGVISDTWPSIRPVLDAFGLTPYFDCFTFSFELGCFKPDHRMYEDALAKMGLPPEECAFIDDGVKNLQGAQAAGIQPVLITAKPGAEECPPGMASIQTISGILELLA